MREKLHSSEQTKHKISILSYFLWVGDIIVDKIDIFTSSKNTHCNTEYRLKNNKTINQLSVMFGQIRRRNGE